MNDTTPPLQTPRGPIVVLLAALVAPLGLPAGFAQPGPASPAAEQAELLVDLALDHGLTVRGNQTRADVRHVRTLLRAAQRLDPTNWQAGLWLYELAALERDDAAATAALERLVAINPAHEHAFALWLDAAERRRQTLEARRAWLTSLLDRPRPPFAESMIRARLAGLALEQANYDAARDLLAEAQRLDPLNPEAALLALRAMPPSATPAEVLAAQLQALQLHPTDPELPWEIGRLLEDAGLHADASVFLNYGMLLAGAPDALPPAARLELVRNRAACGDYLGALEFSRSGLNACASDPAYLMCHYWLGMRTERPIDFAVARGQLERLLSPVKDPQEWPVDLVAQAAWFHCTIDPQPDRALALAQAAAARAHDDPFVARVLGWAQALAGKPAAARETLAPLARTDPFAAYQLARLLKDEGDEAGAARVVQSVGRVHAGSYALDLLASLNLPGLASQPAPESAALRQALAGFRADVLNFWREPARFLEARIEPERTTFAPADRWMLTFSLTNRGDFPISLGPEGLVNPTFLLSITTEGDRRREFPNLLTVSADTLRVLRPGQTISVRRSLVGPPYRAAQLTPQQLQRVSVETLLDAQRTRDGRWVPGPTGQRLRPLAFNRAPAATSADAWNAMLATLRGDDWAARGRALRQVGELLGEHQRHALRPLPYRPQPVPVESIESIFATALRGGDGLRFQALYALQPAGLSRTLADAVQDCLADESWLVRMMALRLLARSDGQFLETARQRNRDDPDELVRDMALSLVEKWSPPASGPTDEPTGGAAP
jgi:tetratricopeptide (TPR) repeat protein